MTKKILIFPFLFIAAIGSIASLAFHICSLFTQIIPNEWVISLLPFLFLIWVPVVISVMAHRKRYPSDMVINVHNYFGMDSYFPNCPSWMKYIAIAFWPYLVLLLIFGVSGLVNGMFFGTGAILLFYFNGACILYSYIND